MNNKKILIISSNPVSNIFNNGKTLAAFFDNYPKENLAQLYFSAAAPDSDICSKYYRISDMDMLKFKLKKSNYCGQAVEPVLGNGSKNADEGKIQNVRKNNFTRLLREVLWRKGWKTDELLKWLDEFKPDVVFFLAGDVVYGHKICQYIVKKYNTKMAMYITDDYVLPRYDIDVFGYIRRTMIRKWMKISVNRADTLFTISELMKSCYKEMYGKDSYVAANMYEPSGTREDKVEKDNLVITYAGGLHYNRDATLLKLIDALEKINNKNEDGKKKIILNIYSGSNVKKSVMKRFNESTSCYFGGLLGPEELEEKLQQSDFLLHVESFSKRNIYDTKLSLSTKIPEYMSYSKPIIAIGPGEVASMQYLKDCSLCITSLKTLQVELEQNMYEEDYVQEIVEKAFQKYDLYHRKDVVRPEIIKRILEI